MSKLLVLKGLQASGKTTFAKQLVKDSGNYFRLNRDDLRAMMFDSKWTREREKVVVEVEKAMARAVLSCGGGVCIDDTNFRDPGWKFLADTAEAGYEVKTFDTPLEECIRRDALRENPVGRNVITKTALRNGLVEFPDKPIVLVDIDGTLSESVGRERHLLSTPKDWKSYFEELDTDLPVVEIFRKVEILSRENTIIVVSGRGAEYEEQTLAWFEKVWSPCPLFPEREVPRFPVFLWLFRDKGNRNDDTIVKAEILKYVPKSKILKVLDDRPKVCRMWEENGLDVEWVRGRDLEEF